MMSVGYLWPRRAAYIMASSIHGSEGTWEGQPGRAGAGGAAQGAHLLRAQVAERRVAVLPIAQRLWP